MIKTLTLLLIIFFTSSVKIFSVENFSLNDFYKKNITLSSKVDSIFNSINDTIRVGQMIIISAGKLGKSDKIVETLIKNKEIGGVIYLRGTKKEHIRRTKKLKNLNHSIPILFSMDAEPSLINKRITDLQKILSTNKIKSKRVSDSITSIINRELNEIDIKLNLAPVCDVSNSNRIIKKRSYGNNLDSIALYTKYFINQSRKDNIVTTAKHFPGHGLVKGDSHKQRVYIDGEFKEISVYQSLIQDSIIAIMIGHIDVTNNKKYSTNGLPSSCSPIIIKQLLQDSLGFKGIVISDALGMKALDKIKNPPLEASKAGCDFLCMPVNENRTINSILQEMNKDKLYKQQVYKSVKKIIRLKLCLRMFPASH